MKLGVVVGTRYLKKGNQYYTYTSYHSDMWKECLEVFDEVVVADKCSEAREIPAAQKPVLVDGVSFVEFPKCQGLLSIIKDIGKMFWAAKKAVKKADIWNLHAPDIGSFCLWFWARVYKVPYMVELRGDQSMLPGYLKLRGVKFPRIVARIMRCVMWLQQSHPLFFIGVSKSLVDGFPARSGCPEIVLSDNRIPEDFYGSPRTWQDGSSCRTIICVGRVEAQKNPFGTMKALAKLDKDGFKDWKFVWLGNGPFLEKTKLLADELGISEKVSMMGFVPWDNVFNILDSADLFLLNSVSEGLPRALVEGMARGLPAIGTNAGGIPELLNSEDIVPMTEDDVLAEKLREVLSNSNRLNDMSQRNFEVAKFYSANVLSAKKIDFYRTLKKRVEELSNEVSSER